MKRWGKELNWLARAEEQLMGFGRGDVEKRGPTSSSIVIAAAISLSGRKMPPTKGT